MDGRIKLEAYLKQLEANYASCVEDEDNDSDRADAILERIHAVEDKLERVYGVTGNED